MVLSPQALFPERKFTRFANVVTEIDNIGEEELVPSLNCLMEWEALFFIRSLFSSSIKLLWFPAQFQHLCVTDQQQPAYNEPWHYRIPKMVAETVI